MDNSIVIYLESPQVEDVQAGRLEHPSLLPLFKLMDIPYAPFAISSKAEMKKSFHHLLQKYSYYDNIFVHLSAHGLKDGDNYIGVALQNQEYISWKAFTDMLLDVHPDIKSKLILCFSTCGGSAGIRIGEDQTSKQYRYIIGPNREVGWAESALAFSVFYFSHICRNEEIGDAVNRMNAVSCTELDVTGNVYICCSGDFQPKLTSFKRMIGKQVRMWDAELEASRKK